jgi:hypothetical protein
LLRFFYLFNPVKPLLKIRFFAVVSKYKKV